MSLKLTLYHNSECSKSRATFELLARAGADFDTVEYLKTPPSEPVLDRLLEMLEMQPEQIVRRGEDEFSELGLDRNPPSSRAEWIRVLCQNPILIERPIVTDGARAVIGRPPENVLKLLV